MGGVLDNTAKILGTVMLVLIGYVAFSTNPPVAEAATHAVAPTHYPWLATITLIGGTVGGYITFSGGHRLIDAGITGQEHLKDVRRYSLHGYVRGCSGSYLVIPSRSGRCVYGLCLRS